MFAGLLAVGLATAYALDRNVHREAFLTAATLALLIVAYDSALKHLSLLGAAALGACRGLNVMVGMGLSLPSVGAAEVGFPLVAFVYGMLVTCVSLLEENPRRLPYAVLLSLLVLTPLAILQLGEDPVGRYACLAPALLLTGRLALTVKPGLHRATVMGTVGLALRAIILLDAAFVFASGRPAAGCVLLGLLPLMGAAGRGVKVLS